MPTLDPLIQATIAGALAILFAFASAHKLRDWRHFRGTLANYGLVPLALVPAVAVAIVATEIAVVAGCLVPATRPDAAWLGTGLLLLYAAAMGANLLRDRPLVDCGCGGFGQRQPLEWWMVRRNVLLAAVAAFAAGPVASRELAFADLFIVACATASATGLYLAHATLAANRRHAQR